MSEIDARLPVEWSSKASRFTLRLGALARAAGCGGLAASAHEARELRETLGEGFAIVTPGVRPTGATAGDQARVVTPGEAIAAGATYLVVGRPILEAPDPARAARQIAVEIEDARRQVAVS